MADERREIVIGIDVEADNARVELQKNLETIQRNKEEIARLRAEYRRTGKGLENMVKRTNELSNENKELTRTNRNLTKTINSEADSLDRLAVELSQVTQELRKTSRTDPNFDRLTRQAKRLTDQLNDAEQKTGNFRRQVGNYAKALAGATGFSDLFSGSLTALAQVGIQAVTNITREAVQIFQDFNKVMSQVQAISQATDEQMARLTQQAKDLGATTQFTATEVGQLQVELSKLGFNTDQIESATETILDLALASGSDLATASQTVAGTLNAFNLDVAESTRVTNVLAGAFTSTALDIDKFNTAIGNVGAISNLAGASIEQVSALLGVLVNNQIDASTAGTQLRSIFIRLAKDGRTYESAMEEINQATDKVATANKIFGVQASGVSAILAQNGDAVDELTQKFLRQEVTVAQLAEIMGDNLDGDIRRLESAYQGLILNQDGLNNVFRGAVQATTALVEGIGVYVDTIKNFLFPVYEQLFESIGEFIKLFFEAGESTLTFREIFERVFAFVSIGTRGLILTIDGFVKFWTQAFTNIGKLIDFFAQKLGFAGSVSTSIFDTILDYIQLILTGFIQLPAVIAGVLASLTQLQNSIVRVFSTLGDSLSDIFAQIRKGNFDAIGSIGSQIQQVASQEAQNIKKAYKEAFEKNKITFTIESEVEEPTTPSSLGTITTDLGQIGGTGGGASKAQKEADKQKRESEKRAKELRKSQEDAIKNALELEKLRISEAQKLRDTENFQIAQDDFELKQLLSQSQFIADQELLQAKIVANEALIALETTTEEQRTLLAQTNASIRAEIAQNEQEFIYDQAKKRADRESKLEKESAKENKKLRDERLKGAQTLTNSLGGLLNQVVADQENAQKTQAVISGIQATVNSALAATQVMTTTGVTPIEKIAAFIAVLTTGLTAVSQIRQASGEGGDVAGTGQAQQIAQQQAQTQAQGLQSLGIANAVANLPQPVVKVTEIQTGLNNANQVQVSTTT